jgi:cyclopropane fatty-acyl-phospholipid synthase-like methyltransferase
MKPADSALDYRPLVAKGYDACAQDFNQARAQGTEDLLLVSGFGLPEGARILDLGCGGLPVTRSLASKHTLIGVDISRQQIQHARGTVPGGQFIIGDMTTIAFRPESFDAVMSFYAIFHTPRETHAALFGRVRKWLRPGGLFVASLAMHADSGYTEDFFGIEMYWSNFDAPAYSEMLTSCGFHVLDQRTISHGYGADAAPETHPMVLAEKLG